MIDFWESHICQIERQELVFYDDSLDHLPITGPRVFLAETGAFTVSVATSFCWDQRRPDGLALYAYRITICYDPEKERDIVSCRLADREWWINYTNGEQSYVYGPGVIGLYPSFSSKFLFYWEYADDDSSIASGLV